MQGARAIIDAIENMGPSTLYMEHDEQGRTRVVRLEMTPSVQALVAEHGGSIERAVREVVERPDRSAELERFLDVIRELVSVREANARESVTDRIAMEGGALPSIRATARAHDRERRATDAWARIKPALLELLGDAS